MDNIVLQGSTVLKEHPRQLTVVLAPLTL
jgi:hypothetical protein